MEKCRYCEEGYSLKAIAKDDCTLEIDDGDRDLSIWEGYGCTAVFKINYCPMCGRKISID